VPLHGRGAFYTRGRALVEWTLHRAYRGHWPARLVRAVGLQRTVQTVRHHVVAPDWPAEQPPIRIAFISDLHAGPTTHASLLDEAFAQLAAVQADVVLLGGDYVFLHAHYIEQIADRLRSIRAPLGIYAVMGNHDLWADDAVIARALTGAGARVLVNERVELRPGVALFGMDDPWTGTRPTGPLFEPDDRARILLVHAPEAMTLLPDERFDVAPCGHTHGGHIALPGAVPIVVPGPLSRRYAHGRHDVGGGRTLVVSRGIGSSEVALRTFADPDVLEVDLGSGIIDGSR
jgi:predicted MPP superfamily phosphohydrolase